jgi:Ca-activated chloride channel homolog
MFRNFVFVLMCLLWVGTARAQSEDGEKQKALSPYFYVAGGDPAVERLPLKSLSADIRISGAVAAVRINQVFENHAQKPIEAVYVFPASTGAAVHGMRMRIGNRVVEAHIDRKKKARQDYEAAKKEGKRASLLEQNRPNVFSTSVANIMPGDVIAVELDYSELLIPEDHLYELVFPAVVGPRYTGGMDTQKDNWVGTPHLTEGQAETYSYSVNAHLQTGVALQEVLSPSHEIVVEAKNSSTADVRLKNPGGGNKDFILRYRLAGDAVQTGLLLSPPTGTDGVGHFALMMEPPARVQTKDIPPREYIFLVDVSGSMGGFPLDTAKSLMSELSKVLRPSDRFNLVLFSGASATLWEKSRPASSQNLAEMQEYLGKQQGGGGTELMGGLREAYAVPRDRATMSRSVVVITDGYVGVEAEAFRFVREHLAEANVFSFGIGSSVNRALMEGLARAGLGEPFVVTNPDQGSAVAAKLRGYIDSPVLAKIKVTFPGFDVFDVLPSAVPDLMASRPLVVLGKYRGEPRGQIVVKGQTGAGPFESALPVVASSDGSDNAVLVKLWARKRAAQLEDELAFGGEESLRETLAELGVRYSLLTAETSFVAIDRVVANTTNELTRSDQPLPLPEGVSNLAVGSEVEISRTEMPPGDPILTVAAEASASKVTAYFPFGLVKELTYDPVTRVWQTRFLVPKTVPDGTYQVPVAILHADGKLERIVATYRIDSTNPDFVTTVTPTKDGVIVSVEARESLREVVVYDPQTQQRVYLIAAVDKLSFTGSLSLAVGKHLLRVVGSDMARNEAEEVVMAEVK